MPRTPMEIGSLVLAIDVGGTKISAGLVEVTTGRVRERRTRPTAGERGGAAVLSDVAELISDITGSALRFGLAEPLPIGLAVPELVRPDGTVTSDQTIAWKDIDVAAALASLGDVVVCSDVRVGALAEARLGAGQPFDSFVYVSVGTGISSSLVLDGVPYAGANGNAIVAASGVLTLTCDVCRAPNALVPEAIASGHGLARLCTERTGRHVEDAAEVFALAADDETAYGVLVEGGAMLGVVVAYLVNVLDPRAVVLGGGLGLTTGIYREAFSRSLRQHIWAETSRAVPIIPAALGPDSPLIGAAIAAAPRPPSTSTIL